MIDSGVGFCVSACWDVLKVTAPEGFVFAARCSATPIPIPTGGASPKDLESQAAEDSCRYGGSPIFSKCTGFLNQAQA